MEMTEENKALLLKDLCERLPYRPKGVKIYKSGLYLPYNITIIGFSGRFVDVLEEIGQVEVEEVRLYLRPMSSMTEEEDEKRIKLGIWRGSQTDGYAVTRISPDIPECYNSQAFQNALKFLLREHFDIFGLIPKGLAIEVTGENNPYITRKG